ncbi:MAG: PadR family transcriptional regulator [Acidobacteriota bacterium]
MTRNDRGVPDPGTWAPFGPFAGHGRFFGSGEVRLAILSLLEEPAHGYELIKRLARRSGGLYKASAGAVYPALQQLEEAGLILSKAIGGRRVYRLTSEGRAELGREEAAVSEIWGRARRWEEWGRWMGPTVVVIAAPLAGLAKEALMALDAAGSSPERQERVREILQRARKEFEEFVRASRADKGR